MFAVVFVVVYFFNLIHVYGQFHMSGVKIQIFENRLHMKLYPVLHCGQVKVRRKINVSSLMTTMYLEGVFKVSIWVFFTVNKRQEVKFLTCCIKLGKCKGLKTLVSE